LRIVPPDAQTQSVTNAEIVVKLKQMCWGEEKREKSYKTALRQVHRRTVGWEGEITDAFASQFEPFGGVSGTKELPKGACLMSVIVTFEGQHELKPDDIPIEVLTKGLVTRGVRFWKRRNRPGGRVEWLPELECKN
jgi:hypothetical protein